MEWRINFSSLWYFNKITCYKTINTSDTTSCHGNYKKYCVITSSVGILLIIICQYIKMNYHMNMLIMKIWHVNFNISKVINFTSKNVFFSVSCFGFLVHFRCIRARNADRDIEHCKKWLFRFELLWVDKLEARNWYEIYCQHFYPFPTPIMYIGGYTQVDSWKCPHKVRLYKHCIL